MTNKSRLKRNYRNTTECYLMNMLLRTFLYLGITPTHGVNIENKTTPYTVSECEIRN